MSTNEEPFWDVHESGECLVGVQGSFFVDETSDNMLVAVRFQFENEIVVLAAQEDDTLGVFGASWECDEKDIVSRDLNKISPWNLAITRPLLWSWRMTNQFGSFDGIQLEFGLNFDDSIFQLQLIVIASQFNINGRTRKGVE